MNISPFTPPSVFCLWRSRTPVCLTGPPTHPPPPNGFSFCFIWPAGGLTVLLLHKGFSSTTHVCHTCVVRKQSRQDERWRSRERSLGKTCTVCSLRHDWEGVDWCEHVDKCSKKEEIAILQRQGHTKNIEVMRVHLIWNRKIFEHLVQNNNKKLPKFFFYSNNVVFGCMSRCIKLSLSQSNKISCPTNRISGK